MSALFNPERQREIAEWCAKDILTMPMNADRVENVTNRVSRAFLEFATMISTDMAGFLESRKKEAANE
jgi:hypothetical protein